MQSRKIHQEKCAYVYLKVLSPCEAEAGSPRSQWAIKGKVPPTAIAAANAKVTEVIDEAKVKKRADRTHETYSFLTSAQKYEVGKRAAEFGIIATT